MKISLGSLTEKERSDYESLANALGITLIELLELNFHNENIFNATGIATQVKYVFDGNNPFNILHKIKGLSDDNSIILSTKSLSFFV